MSRNKICSSEECFAVHFSHSWYEKEIAFSKAVKMKNSVAEFNLSLRKISNDHRKMLSIHIVKKMPRVFGSFQFFSTNFEKPIPFHTSLLFDNKPSGDYVISSTIERSYAEETGTIIGVKWIPSEKNETTEKLPYTLSESFGWLLKTGEFSDMTIETPDGSRFCVHNAVLSARSPVLRSMLKSDMLEVKNKCIKIVDFSTETIQSMITFMYTNRLPQFSYDLTKELLAAADKYDLKDLKEACGQNLLKHIDVSNAPDLLLIGDMHREEIVKRDVLQFISENIQKFSDPTKLDKLMNNPDVLAHIIASLANNAGPIYSLPSE